MLLKPSVLCLLFSIACALPLRAAESVLFDFADQATLAKAKARAAQLSLVSNENGPALRVATSAGDAWPGVNFPSPDGLDLAPHGELVFSVKNPGKEPLQVNCSIASSPKGAPASGDPGRATQIPLKAGESREIRILLIPAVQIPGLKRDDLFGMRGVPFFNAKSIFVEHVTKIAFFLSKQESPQVFEVGNLRLTGKPVTADAVPEKPFPLIDEFGQFKHREWPGKTHSVEEMHARKDEEAKHLASSSRPASWDRFGGWNDSPQLEGTGWFRTAKHDGRWQLVDPDGRLFFSLGIDGVGIGNATIISEREHWFEKLPPDDAANREFYMTWKVTMPKDHFFGKNSRAFNFHRHNLALKYGPDWKRAFVETSVARLPAWGINTIGNWSDPEICALQKAPYVSFLKGSAPPIEGSSGYWGKFDDLFHADFKEKLRRQTTAKPIAATKDDPWCIGYFVDNELSWGDETSLALATLASPGEQPAKQVFVADLKAKYQTIAALNTAWKTDHASWDALLASTKAPDFEASRPDLEAFVGKIADTYFSSVREVLKEFAPHHLYLGCRFFSGTVNPIVAKASARHCDVVSFNGYARDLSAMLPELEKAGDKPYIIGEFHFGALDRGLFHTGIIPTENQAERAKAFTEYVTVCLNHPNIVGCHWFQYTDSPTTGRVWDGENYQIGFTDDCDTPYVELIGASRAISEKLYQRRAGKRRTPRENC